MNSSGPRHRKIRAVAALAVIVASLSPGAAQEKVILTEFMAANTRGLTDRDRQRSDWIEIYNAGIAPVNLDGWFLTDNRSKLTKWRFPATPLGPGEFLLVFASKKDRRVPGGELHTNFKLDAGRGYLALVKPDGVTVASDFGPEYPPQVPNASFGLDMAERSAPLVTAATPKRLWVPTTDLGLAWTTPAFDDSAWLSTTNTVEFDTETNHATSLAAELRSRMLGKNPSVYLRLPFRVSEGDSEMLKLRLRYDDGFIAYLNGREVARRTAPEKPRWNATATGGHGAHTPVVLEELFDQPAGRYTLAQLDPITKPKVTLHGEGVPGGFLRLVNGHQTNQVNSIAFSQTATGSFDSVVADFDFRWKGTGEGTERLVMLLIPTSVYPANSPGIDLAAFREAKDPKFNAVLAVQLLHSPETGQNALTIHWDRIKRTTANLSADAFGSRTFHHAQVRLKHTEQGAMLGVTLTADVHGPRKQTFVPVSQLFIPGLHPYPARLQFAARIGHWDQTIDLDNVRVEYVPAGEQVAEEFDLSDQVRLLRPGLNVLALQGLNRTADDPTFQLLPELMAGYSALRSIQTRYFATPTPRAVNREGRRGLSPPPVFSKRGGVFANGVRLELTAQSGVVRYTLDGSEPTASSEAYAAPLQLAGSTLVKARTFAPDLLPSATVSEAFTVPEENLLGFSSNLPLLILNPFGQYLSANNKATLPIRLIDTINGRSSLLGAADFDGRASVNIRGFSTLRQPKNSLTFRLKDENEEKLKASLLGLPKESDWVLYAPYSDKTLIRDVLAYELSNKMGRYAPRTRFVEVFIDRSGGKLSLRDYMGVYVLAERITRGKNRVNVTELFGSDNTEPNITGGYIFKRDHSERWEPSFRTSRGVHYNYVEPKAEELSREQMSWLTRYMNRFEQALYGADFRDPARGYANYLDVDSFIDQHWLIELSKNIDGFRYSAFLHKERGGKLQMGPAWDWNLSFGNADYHDGSNPEGWYTPLLRENELCWFRRLSEDPDFTQRAIDRWGELRRTVFAPANVLARVDELAAFLNEAQTRNFRRWPILGRRINPNDFVGNTYQEEISWMKQWIQHRIAWIDSQFASPPVLARSNGAVTLRAPAGKIYYTLDGTDPRLPGGAISPKASVYAAPLRPGETSSLVARAYYRGGWSSPTTAKFQPGERLPQSGK